MITLSAPRTLAVGKRDAKPSAPSFHCATQPAHPSYLFGLEPRAHTQRIADRTGATSSRPLGARYSAAEGIAGVRRRDIRSEAVRVLRNRSPPLPTSDQNSATASDGPRYECSTFRSGKIFGDRKDQEGPLSAIATANPVGTTAPFVTLHVVSSSSARVERKKPVERILRPK